MKNVLLPILFTITINVKAQSVYTGFPSLVWPKLYTITFQKDPNGEFDKPVFTKEVKALAGKEVVLPGYIIPFQGVTKESHFMLSSLPINACFFVAWVDRKV